MSRILAHEEELSFHSLFVTLLQNSILTEEQLQRYGDWITAIARDYVENEPSEDVVDEGPNGTEEERAAFREEIGGENEDAMERLSQLFPDLQSESSDAILRKQVPASLTQPIVEDDEDDLPAGLENQEDAEYQAFLTQTLGEAAAVEELSESALKKRKAEGAFRRTMAELKANKILPVKWPSFARTTKSKCLCGNGWVAPLCVDGSCNKCCSQRQLRLSRFDCSVHQMFFRCISCNRLCKNLCLSHICRYCCTHRREGPCKVHDGFRRVNEVLGFVYRDSPEVLWNTTRSNLWNAWGKGNFGHVALYLMQLIKYKSRATKMSSNEKLLENTVFILGLARTLLRNSNLALMNMYVSCLSWYKDHLVPWLRICTARMIWESEWLVTDAVLSELMTESPDTDFIKSMLMKQPTLEWLQGIIAERKGLVIDARKHYEACISGQSHMTTAVMGLLRLNGGFQVSASRRLLKDLRKKYPDNLRWAIMYQKALRNPEDAKHFDLHAFILDQSPSSVASLEWMLRHAREQPFVVMSMVARGLIVERDWLSPWWTALHDLLVRFGKPSGTFWAFFLDEMFCITLPGEVSEERPALVVKWLLS